MTVNYLKPYLEAFFRLPRLWFLFFIQIFLDAALGIMTFLPLFLAFSLFLRAVLLSPPATGNVFDNFVGTLRIMLGNTGVAFALSGFMAVYLLTVFMMKVLIRSVLLAGVADIALGLPFAGPSRLLSGAIRLWPRLIPLYAIGFVVNVIFISAFGFALLSLLYIVDPYIGNELPSVRHIADFIYVVAVLGPVVGLYMLGLALWYLTHLTISVDNLRCMDAFKVSWRVLRRYCLQLTIFMLALLYPATLLGLVSSAGSSMLMNIRIQSGFAGVSSTASSAWSITFALLGYAVSFFVILGMAVFYRKLSKEEFLAKAS